MNPVAIHCRDLCSEQQHTHTQASVVAHCISAAAHRKCNDQSLIAALTTTDGDLAFLPHPSLHHQHLSSSSSNKSLWGASPSPSSSSPSSFSRTRVPSSDHPFGSNGSPPCICTCTHHSFPLHSVDDIEPEAPLHNERKRTFNRMGELAWRAISQQPHAHSTHKRVILRYTLKASKTRNEKRWTCEVNARSVRPFGATFLGAHR